MEIQLFYIKNLCCPRCINSLRELFTQNGILVIEIKNSVATIMANNNTINNLYEVLECNGFELLNDREQIVVDKIKSELLQYIIDNTNTKMSFYLESRLNLRYSYLSKVFSRLEKSTIEKYLIKLKIDRVKELLLSKQLNLSEIAFMFNYSSVQALSQQFKVTHGITVKDFKSNINAFSYA